DFYAAIRDQRPPIASAEAGFRALEIALAAYASGVTGQVISLPLTADNSVFRMGIDGLTNLKAGSESRTRRAGIFGLRD
ncbi:MAG: gfo/Idh/MocA family oxidoreductase, partial [Anaerolineae bacterium]|nr:gfo/Idh/MocA family oxidoreductase [Anaerolineae bacterium]